VLSIFFLLLLPPPPPTLFPYTTLFRSRSARVRAATGFRRPATGFQPIGRGPEEVEHRAVDEPAGHLRIEAARALVADRLGDPSDNPAGHSALRRLEPGRGAAPRREPAGRTD